MSIAFDAVSNSEHGNNNTDLTWSHTCTGTDRFLAVFFYITNATADPLVDVTYAGVTMTQALPRVAKDGSVTEYSYAYYLINPTAGANNVVINVDNILNHFIIAGAVSYTGCDQTTQPNTTSSNHASAATSATTTVTTTIDNCWAALSLFPDSDVTPTASTNSTQRGTIGSAGPFVLYDSNGPATPAGSFSQVQTFDSSSYVTMQIAFQPSGVSAATRNTLLLMGVG